MTVLPLEPHTEAEEATLKRFEGAEPAEESTVEKVARAMWLGGAAVYGHPWDEAAWDDQVHFRNLAAAAIEAMKGPSPSEALRSELVRAIRANGIWRERLQRVEALTYASDDGSEYEHNAGCEGERECPACWAQQIRAALAAPVAQAGEGTVSGAELIAAERQRQVEAEGWTPEHDAVHGSEHLARAAACYATPVAARVMRTITVPPSERGGVQVPIGWPWHPDYWKPTPDDRVRELVKAGALIAAEIDRLKARDGAR